MNLNTTINFDTEKMLVIEIENVSNHLPADIQIISNFNNVKLRFNAFLYKHCKHVLIFLRLLWIYVVYVETQF